MSHEKIEALEIGLYEDYLEELQKKYYGGINKVLGEPWFTKTDAEMEAEACDRDWETTAHLKLC